MKKFLFLAMALLVSLCGMAAVDFEQDGISYAVISEDDLTAEVVYNNGAYVGDVTIPARVTFDGKTYTVTSIHNQAFFKCTDLYSVSIPATVTDLGQYTFSGCTSLQSVELPTGLTYVPNGTFYGCSSLQSIELPETVESLGDYSFSNCSSLSNINMPVGIKALGKSALMATALKEFAVPQGVTELAPYVLALTSKLETVTICEGVTSIGECALQGNLAMKTVQLPSSLKNIDASAFAQCLALEEIVVPDGVDALPAKCFYNDMALRKIVIGSGVTTIGEDCFARYKDTKDAPRLTDVYLKAEIVVSGGDSFLDEACSGATLHVPETLVSAYKSQADWARFGSIVAISDGEQTGIDNIAAEGKISDTNTYTLDGKLAPMSFRGIVVKGDRKMLKLK